MKYLGYALVVWGFLDFGLSYAGVDVWMDWLGMELPEAMWRFSGMIAVVIGFGIVKLSGGDDDEVTEEPADEG